MLKNYFFYRKKILVFNKKNLSTLTKCDCIELYRIRNVNS